MTDAHAIPTLAQELERKTFEHLERIALDHQQGKITRPAFEAGVTALWNVASGLVSPLLQEALSEAGKHAGKVSQTETALMLSPNKAIVVVRDVGCSKLDLWICDEAQHGWTRDFGVDVDGPAASKAMYDQTITKLEKSGFTAVTTR